MLQIAVAGVPFDLTLITSAMELRHGFNAGIRSSWDVISTTRASPPCDGPRPGSGALHH